MNFIYLNWTPILFPFITGFFRFRYFNNPLKVLYFFVCAGTFNEILTRFLIFIFDLRNTMPIIHIYGFLSFLLLFVFYSKLIDGVFRRGVLLVMDFLFLLFWVINSVFIQNLSEFPSLPRAIGQLVIIVYSIVFFYKVMVEAKIQKLKDDPLIWINTAILIYYTGNLFFYILFNIILEYSREFSKVTVNYFSLLNALFYILIAIGFFKSKPQKFQQQKKFQPIH